jgi:hypothetical protein
MSDDVDVVVLERLRASKRKGEAADYKDGYDLGTKWAEQSAEVSALQRLEQFRDDREAEPDYDWDYYFSEQEGSDDETDASLFFAIMAPEAATDPQAVVKDFWRSVTGDSLQQATNRGSFLKGFAEGAIDLWLSVKDKL